MFKNISSDIFQYGIKPFLIPDKKRIANKAYNCIGNLIAERQLNRVCFTNLTIDINIYLLNDPDDYKIKYNIIQDLHTHFNNGPNRHQVGVYYLSINKGKDIHKKIIDFFDVVVLEAALLNKPLYLNSCIFRKLITYYLENDKFNLYRYLPLLYGQNLSIK